MAITIVISDTTSLHNPYTTTTITCMLPHTSMMVSSAHLNFWGWEEWSS